MHIILWYDQKITNVDLPLRKEGHHSWRVRVSELRCKSQQIPYSTFKRVVHGHGESKQLANDDASALTNNWNTYNHTTLHSRESLQRAENRMPQVFLAVDVYITQWQDHFESSSALSNLSVTLSPDFMDKIIDKTKRVILLHIILLLSIFSSIR